MKQLHLDFQCLFMMRSNAHDSIFYEQEQHESTDSRPKFCEGEEQSPDAYGEAMAILAGLDREFAFNNPAAPTTTVAPTKPHVDGKDPRFIERCTKCKPYETFRRLSTRQYLVV